WVLRASTRLAVEAGSELQDATRFGRGRFRMRSRGPPTRESPSEIRRMDDAAPAAGRASYASSHRPPQRGRAKSVGSPGHGGPDPPSPPVASAPSSAAPSVAASEPAPSTPAASAVTESPTPSIDPADFVATIDNAWFPLIPGTSWTYQGVKDGEKAIDAVTVTRDTKMVAGVACVVVHDELMVAGELAETTD